MENFKLSIIKKSKVMDKKKITFLKARNISANIFMKEREKIEFIV